jgi:PncC family amidohydrolase
MITSVPGSSAFFLGGVVSYSNSSKENILKVDLSTMIENGAVSERTAIEMAIGAKDLFGSDISVSITGIAGPDGGTDAKPVGLVWIGLSWENKSSAKKFNFSGDRNAIRSSAANAALELLINIIEIVQNSKTKTRS